MRDTLDAGLAGQDIAYEADAAPGGQRAGRRARRGGPRRRGRPELIRGSVQDITERRRRGERSRSRPPTPRRPPASTRSPTRLQRSLLPGAHRRPRAPRGRDLLPRRRRGNPGRRRLVRRDRGSAPVGPPRGRRRDGPRCRPRRSWAGLCARRSGPTRGSTCRRRRPRVPRRHRPRGSGRTRSSPACTPSRPGRPDAPDGQRRPADPGGAGPGVAHPAGRRGPATRRGTVHAHPAGRQARRGLAGGALHRRPRGAAGRTSSTACTRSPASPARWRSYPAEDASVWCRRCCRTDRTTTWSCWWPASTRRRRARPRPTVRNESAVVEARHLVARHLTERSVPRTLVDEAVLTTSGC